MSGMTDRSFLILSGASAIAFAAIITGLNGLLVPAGAPTPGAGASEAVSFYEGSALVLWAGSSIPLAWVFSTLFAAGALSRVRGAAGRPWGLVGFAGVVAQNVTFTVVIGVRLAMSSAEEHEGADLLWNLHEALFGLNGTFLALAMVGFSLAGRAGGVIGRFHARIGLTGAVLQIVSACLTPVVMGGNGAAGLVGLSGWLLWVGWLVVYGIRLLPRTHLPDPGGGVAAEAA
ncbi:hypothetical protein [Isoptericola cucumis]|uniref:DUF4386 family protein n=1 Tax=Isoptericola cucumis TaxID=1776856 RepID=A0ABQ2B8P0_9MICO|nr:hypothetical protein [Isoptericola cucumis]GGI08339.1 hypothetical protein GCM10007368_20670 [Isoptericola cucumis]